MKSKTYCTRLFNGLHTMNDGKYSPCCLLVPAKNENLKDFSIDTHTPFEWFDSPEMDELRLQSLAGEKVDGCEVCYDVEEQGQESARDFFNWHESTTTNDIELRLKIFGNDCNLSCHMCNPSNSSTRTKELKSMDFYGEGGFASPKYKTINNKRFSVFVDEIIKNIDRIKIIHFSGGEPFRAGRHFDFIKKIPKEYRRNIVLTYNTNLTSLALRNDKFEDYADDFKKVSLQVSVDGYQENLAWLRYPIDIDVFEANLVKYRKYIIPLQFTATRLSLPFLRDTINYYGDKFDMAVEVASVVVKPMIMSPRNIADDVKEKLLVDFADLFADTKMRLGPTLTQLQQDRMPELDKMFVAYVKGLDKQRGTDANKIFGKIYD
jgi:organic radical activating enzyme